MTGSIDTVINIIAKNPPSILMVIGFLIYVMGNTIFGGLCIILGVILQLIWLGR
jgi:hypothetical protein